MNEPPVINKLAGRLAARRLHPRVSHDYLLLSVFLFDYRLPPNREGNFARVKPHITIVAIARFLRTDRFERAPEGIFSTSTCAPREARRNAKRNELESWARGSLPRRKGERKLHEGKDESARQKAANDFQNAPDH